MKHLSTFLLFLVTLPFFAQEKYPRVEKVVVEEKLVFGKIDTYPITLSLAFEQYSNYHLGVYSVQGWYYYDKIKTRIPLAGLYDNGELILYQFNDTTKRMELLHFSEMKQNHWEDMKYYKNLTGYNEKFVLTNSESYWTNGTKKLNVNLSTDDLQIRTVQEYLRLDENKALDLHNFGDWTWNFEMVAYEGGRFILKYEYGSRLYAMGQCGAGTEAGYFVMDFDKNQNLIAYQEFVYESCNRLIYTERKEEIAQHQILYHCYDELHEEEFELSLDLTQLKIEKKVKPSAME